MYITIFFHPFFVRFTMKTFFSLLLTLLLLSVWTYPLFGQDFSNVRVNHLTENRQSMYGGNSLAVHEGTIYVIWTDWSERTPLFAYVSKSTDGGATFDDGVVVSPEGIQMFCSMIADDEGALYVAWTGTPDGENPGGIYFAKSTDGATSFSEQLVISPTGAFPQIAVHEEYVYIFYIDIEPSDDDESEWPVNYRFARSANGGETFEDPFTINEEELTFDIDHDNTIHVDENGTLYLIWPEGRKEGGGSDLYLARSTDNGAGFGSHVMINDPESYPGYERSGAAVDVRGSNVYVAWASDSDSDDEEGNEDGNGIYFSKSTDGGATFEQERRISYGIDLANLKVSEEGIIYVAYPDWRGEDAWGLYLSASIDGGSSFPDNNTRFISEASSGAYGPSMHVESGENDRVYFVWMDSRTGDHDIYFAQGEILKEELTHVHDLAELPAKIILHQNYPNPFNPVTTLRWELEAGQYVRLRVIDPLGREVATLTDRHYPAGVHALPFDASGLSSGIYIYRLETGDVILNKKMTVLK